MKIQSKYMYGGKSTYRQGGVLKSVPKGNRGLSKLPTSVRNKMGYMEEGGSVQSSPESKYTYDDYKNFIKEVTAFKTRYGSMGYVSPGHAGEEDFLKSFPSQGSRTAKGYSYDDYVRESEALFSKAKSFNDQGYNIHTRYTGGDDYFKVYDQTPFENSRLINPETKPTKTSKGPNMDTEDVDDVSDAGDTSDTSTDMDPSTGTSTGTMTRRERRQQRRSDRRQRRADRKSGRRQRRAERKANRQARRSARAEGDVTPQTRGGIDDFTPKREMDYQPNREMNYQPQSKTMKDGGVTDNKKNRREEMRKQREERRKSIIRDRRKRQRDERRSNRKSTM